MRSGDSLRFRPLKPGLGRYQAKSQVTQSLRFACGSPGRLKRRHGLRPDLVVRVAALLEVVDAHCAGYQGESHSKTQSQVQPGAYPTPPVH